MIMTYALWAFEIRQRTGTNSVWAVISIVPMVVAVLRYAVDVDGGNAGEPEEIAFRDRVLQVLGVSWVVCVALSAFL
jgi:decaprenyl-phosphate phosphoribosyltransferase